MNRYTILYIKKKILKEMLFSLLKILNLSAGHLISLKGTQSITLNYFKNFLNIS